jgi:hypothetical protein
MKWLLAAIVAALLAVGVYQQLNSVKTTYVNGLTPYTTLPGRGYILERDCYIFKLKRDDTSFPLLGAHETVPELPADVKEANIGADLPGVRILGVLRVGDHFRIVSVRRDKSRTRTTVTFEILLDNEDSRPYPRLDAYWILDHSPEKDGGAPSVMTDYAVLHGKL